MQRSYSGYAQPQVQPRSPQAYAYPYPDPRVDTYGAYASPQMQQQPMQTLQQMQQQLQQAPPMQALQQMQQQQQQQQQQTTAPSATADQAEPWNHVANETRIVHKVRVVESTSRLLSAPNKVMMCPLASKASGGVYRALVKHKKGANAEVSATAHKGVTVTSIEVVGYRNTLPHDVGVRIDDIGCHFGHIEGTTGQGYLYIIPSNSPSYSTVHEVMYESSKDAFGALASAYGGLDVDKLKREVVLMSDKTVFVPKTSMAVRAAVDAARMIYVSGEKSADGRTRIDPKLEYIAGTNDLAEIEGKVSMSKEFFDGFLKSVTENVMAATKPVDLDALNVALSNTNSGEPLASNENTLDEGTEPTPSKMHEVSIDIAISFMTRNDI